MAKSSQLKRVITKSGQVRYYQAGKRLKTKTGQKKWVNQNYSHPENFTKNELRSFKAKKRYDESFKFKGVQIQSIYIELLRKMAFPIPKSKEKDLSKILNKSGTPVFKNFVDIIRLIDQKAKTDKNFLQYCTDVGLPGYRNRSVETFNDNRAKSVVDFIDLINTPSLKNYTLSVIDPQGDEHRGRVLGLLAIKDFEIMVGTAIQLVAENAAFTRFCYDYSLDIPSREILLDLTDINELKDIQDYISGPDSGSGDTITIADKFKDCVIEIMFS